MKNLWQCSLLIGAAFLLFPTSGLRAQVLATGDNYSTFPFSSPNWNAGQLLAVGLTGEGTVTIFGSGSVTSQTGVLGNGDGSNGLVKVTGGTWTNSIYIFVGYYGTGVLEISDSGQVITSLATIGESRGTGSIIRVTGGTFNLSESLAVGSFGEGRLELSGNGLIVSASAFISRTETASGVASVSGGNWINSGLLDVGRSGYGVLDLTGGTVTTPVTEVARFNTSTGVLNIGTGTTAGVLNTSSVIGGEGDATLNFNHNENSYFFTNTGTSGGTGISIDGSIKVNHIGTGTTILTAPSTYTGGTTISSGILQTRNAAALGNGSLTFNSGGTLQIVNTLQLGNETFTVTNGTANIFGDSLETPNGFNKNGSGLLSISANVTSGGTVNMNNGGLLVNGRFQASGLVNVNNGSLIVNGMLQASGLNIQPGGTLGGAGMIVGNVQNFGNVSPGNSPGTLSIVGDFIQTSNGVLNIEVASASNFDRLIVSGNAALAGTLNIIPFDGFMPEFGQQFAFLQAGSVTGQFDIINAPAEFRLQFDPTTGALVLAPATYTLAAVTDNQRRVAEALDTFIPATTGDTETVSLALDLLSSEQYPGAFDQIAPTLHETIADITLEQAFTQTQLLNQRMSSVRLGARGFQAIGFNAEPLRHDKDGKSVADPKDLKAQVAAFEDPRWSTWVIGSGMFANIRGINQMPNLSFQSGGFLVGTDYAWSENLTTGLYGGYQGTYANYGDSGNARINSAIFGAYASYANGGFYADAVIGGGYSNYKVNRSIEFSTIDRTAASQQNGGQFTSGLNLGYDWKASGFTFGPVLGAQYTLASISPFTETGAGALNLRVAQQNANSLRTTLGGRIAYNWNVSETITIIPEVRAFWQHEFLENPRTIGASLNSGNGPGFNYTTAAPDRDAIFTAAGVTAQFGETWNASLYYNTSFANETTLIHTISASLGLSF